MNMVPIIINEDENILNELPINRMISETKIESSLPIFLAIGGTITDNKAKQINGIVVRIPIILLEMCNDC